MERCRLWSVGQCFKLWRRSLQNVYSFCNIAFPLTEVSASKVSAIWKKNSIKKRLGGYRIETVLTAGPCLSDVSLSDSKQAGREKPATIFPSDYLIIFNAINLEFGACLTQNSMAQEQPKSWVVVKRTLRELFGQNLLDRIMTQKCSLAAENCSKC